MLQTFVNFINDVRGALVSAAAGAVIATMGKLAYDVFQQRKTNKAIANRDIGVEFANLVYTNHQRSSNQSVYTQRLRTVSSKLDLKKVFNGKAQKRYLQYLERANELACQSKFNPYIPDYIEQAVKDCHSGFWQSTIDRFAPVDPKEIRKNMLRDLKIGVAEFIQERATEYPRLFDGVDFDAEAGTTLYPMPVGEKDSEHGQVKIILMRENDLRDGVIADKEEDVFVRVASSKYRPEEDHRDMLRWRTNVKLKARLRDEATRKEMGAQVGLPVVLQMATQEQRDKVGVLPPPKLAS